MRRAASHRLYPKQIDAEMMSSRPHPSVAPQRHPILIGISGTRIFDRTNATADCAIAEALADRLRTVFEAVVGSDGLEPPTSCV
jgi:hypothetical protein